MTPTPGAIRAAKWLCHIQKIKEPSTIAYWAGVIDFHNEPLLLASRAILHCLKNDVAPETVDAAVAALEKEL